MLQSLIDMIQYLTPVSAQDFATNFVEIVILEYLFRVVFLPNGTNQNERNGSFV